jgi:hypothetical protein
MKKTRAIDLVLMITIAFSSYQLFQASLFPIHFLEFFHLRFIAAIGFIFIAVYFFRRNGASKESWASNILITLSLIMAVFFLLHVDGKRQWMEIEKISSLFMLIAPIVFLYDLSKLVNKTEFLSKVKAFFTTLLNLTIGFGILGGLAYFLYFSPDRRENKSFIELDTQQQIQNLEWSSILGASWLTLEDNHTFTIENKSSKNEETKEVGRGNWTFDRETNSVTLSSNGISQTYYYFLDQEYEIAFLGSKPIEASTLGNSWEAFIPRKKDEQN